MNFIKYIVWLLFPKRCAVCGEIIQRNSAVCKKCNDELEYIGKNCSVCGAVKKHCECKRHVYRFSGCVAPFYKGDNSMKMIYRFKLGNKTDCADFLSDKMCQKIKEYFGSVEFDRVTSVPMSPFKYFYKGYNHSEVIAKSVAQKLGIEYCRLLKKRPFKKSQHTLGHKERIENVKNMFYFRDENHYKTVLLIDDVKSTGATLNECTKELLFSGVRDVYCATAVMNVFGIEKK